MRPVGPARASVWESLWVSERVQLFICPLSSLNFPRSEARSPAPSHPLWSPSASGSHPLSGSPFFSPFSLLHLLGLRKSGRESRRGRSRLLCAEGKAAPSSSFHLRKKCTHPSLGEPCKRTAHPNPLSARPRGGCAFMLQQLPPSSLCKQVWWLLC